jgi:hypothetical protein
MAETRTYSGGCHCGQVRYAVTLELGPVLKCNCSICSKTGSLLAAVSPSQFELLSGSDRLSDYQFAKKNIHHLFCKDCGIRSFARGKGPGGKDMLVVNVRCLDDVDAESLPVTHFDGRSL